MWRTLTGEGPRGSGASATSVPGGELTSAGFHSHDSPLLGLLSAVSRPAVSFLQRYLPAPGRAVKRDFLGQNSDFLGPFDDILPPSQLHSLPWVGLQELGIHQPDEMSFQTGYSTPVSTVLVSPSSGGSKTWWGSFWSGEDDQRRLKGVNGGLLCAESSRTSVFVSGENAGAALDKSPFIANTIPQLTLIQSLTVLTPDQDNGYYSLEEEQLLVVKAQLQGAPPGMVTEEEAAEEEQETEEEKIEEELPVLKCDNKAIAFIMGCQCSDDSQSESSSEEEEESEEEEDDDGFDSECSSEISDSDEFDSETERLWSALCQNDDPYNPRNFTAKLASAPKPIPKPGLGSGPGLEEAQCSPVSSVSSSVSSSCSSSSWDEASESEEQENLRLLGSFCSSDPYSPLNFQAPIRTKPGLKPGSEPSSSGPTCEGAEERRERNVSEPTRSESSTRATSNSKKKKVRFCDDVQFFFVGCEERCGPWEEFARDRARFLRRCLEIEETIGYCLSPGHRGRVYNTNFREQDGQSEGQEVQTCQSETEERPSSQSETEEHPSSQSETEEHPSS